MKQRGIRKSRTSNTHSGGWYASRPFLMSLTLVPDGEPYPSLSWLNNVVVRILMLPPKPVKSWPILFPVAPPPERTRRIVGEIEMPPPPDHTLVVEPRY